MISEGSCGTEDWSNDAKKISFALQEYIFVYIKIEKSNVKS